MLHQYAKEGSLDGIKTIIGTLSSNDLDKADPQGRTALHLALWNSHWDCAYFLMSRGADPLQSDQSQNRSIIHFALMGHASVDVLDNLMSNLTPFQKNQILQNLDSQGDSPLHVAARFQLLESLEYLVNQGLDVNILNNAAYTALHCCAGTGFIAGAEYLLSVRANPFLINANGDSVVHLARRAGQVEFSDHIQQWIAVSWSEKLIGFVEESEDLEVIIADLLVMHHSFNYFYSSEGLEEHVAKITSNNYDTHDNKITSFRDFQEKIFTKVAHRLLEQTEFRYPLLTCHIFLEQSDFFLEKKDFNTAMGYASAAEAYYDRFVKSIDRSFQERLSNQKLRVLVLYRSQELDIVVSILPQIQIAFRKQALLNHRKQMKPKIQNAGFTIIQLMEENTNFFKEFTFALFKDAFHLSSYAEPAEETFALLGLGSMGRGEMSLFSDLEFAVLLNENSTQKKEQILQAVKIMQLLVIGLGETTLECLPNKYSPTPAGFRFDEGGNTPLPTLGESSKFMGTVDELVSLQLDRNSFYTIARNALRTTCLIGGSSRLFNKYESALWKCLLKTNTTQNWLFQKRWLNKIEVIELMKGDIGDFSPMQVATAKYNRDIHSFDVKAELYRLPSQTISNLCLYYGIKEKGTWQRIHSLVKKSIISKTAGSRLSELMAIVIRMRLVLHDHYQEENERVHHASLMEPSQDPRDRPMYSLSQKGLKELIDLYHVLMPIAQAITAFIRLATEADGDKIKVKNNPFHNNELWLESAFAAVTAYERLGVPEVARARYQQQLTMNPENLDLHVQYIDFEESQWQILQKQNISVDRLAEAWSKNLILSLIQSREPEAHYISYFEALPDWHHNFIYYVKHYLPENEDILSHLRTSERNKHSDRLEYFSSMLTQNDTLATWSDFRDITQDKLHDLLCKYKLEIRKLPPRAQTLALILSLNVLYRNKQFMKNKLEAQQFQLDHVVNRCAKQLTQQYSQTQPYLNVYEKLPLRIRQGFRQALLRLLDVEETNAFLSSILLNLNEFPDEAGNRGRWEETKANWQEALLKLVINTGTHVDENLVTLTSVLLRTSCSDGYLCDKENNCSYRMGKFRLHPSVSDQLLTTSGEFRIRTINGSRHSVSPLQLEGDAIAISHLHVKAYPEMPGMTYLIERLHHYIIGHGTCLSELARLDFPDRESVPILLSETIHGETLDQVLTQNPSRLQELNFNRYSGLVLLAILTNPEDGIPTNFVVKDLTESEGGGVSLVSIDHDHALFPAYLFFQNELSGELSPSLQIKTILFCLDQMREVIDADVCNNFLKLKPKMLLRQVLKEAQLQNQHYEEMFSAKQIQSFHRGSGSSKSSTIPIPIKSGDISKLYHKMVRLQHLLSQNSNITLLDCLLHIEPRAGLVYQRALMELDSPKERLKKVGQYPVNIKGKLTSYTSAKTVLLVSTLLNLKEFEHISSLRPEEGLSELDRMSYQQDRLATIQEQVKNGDLREFNALLAKHHKDWIINGRDVVESRVFDPTTPKIETNGQSFVGMFDNSGSAVSESIITLSFPGLDFQSMQTNHQLDLLNAVIQSKVVFNRLLLPNCRAMTPDLFEMLIANSPDLVQLDLSGVQVLQDQHIVLLGNLTGRTLKKIFLKDVIGLSVFEGSFLELRELNINRSSIKSINISSPKLESISSKEVSLVSVKTQTRSILRLDLTGSQTLSKLIHSIPNDECWYPLFLDDYSILPRPELGRKYVCFLFLSYHAEFSTNVEVELPWKMIFEYKSYDELVSILFAAKEFHEIAEIHIKNCFLNIPEFSSILANIENCKFQVYFNNILCDPVDFPKMSLLTYASLFMNKYVINALVKNMRPSLVEELQSLPQELAEYVSNNASMPFYYDLILCISLVNYYELECQKPLLDENQRLSIDYQSAQGIVSLMRSFPECTARLMNVIKESSKMGTLGILSAFSMTLLNAAGVSFSLLDLEGVNVSGADLSGALFHSTNLHNADLSYCKLDNSMFSSSCLENTDFSEFQVNEFPMKNFSYLLLCASWSASGLYFAVASGATVHLFGKDRNLLHELHGHSDCVKALCFEENEDFLLSGGEDRSVLIWDLNTGENINNISELPGLINEIYSLQTASPSFVVAFSTGEISMSAYNLKTCELIRSVAIDPKPISCLALMNVNEILSASTDGIIRSWTISLETNSFFYQYNNAKISALSVHPNESNRFLSCSIDGSIVEWIHENSEPNKAWKYIRDGVELTDITYMYNASFFATSGSDGAVTLWSWEHDTPQSFITIHNGNVAFLAQSPNSQLLLTGGADKFLRFWNIEYQTAISNKMESSKINAVEISPDTTRLLVCRDNGLFEEWSCIDGSRINSYAGHVGPVRSTAYNFDGSRVLSAGSDLIIKEWSVYSGDVLKQYLGHSDWINCVTYITGKKMIASGSHDQSVRLWSTRTSECLSEFFGHSDWVKSLTYVESQECLVSIDFQGKKLHWSIKSEQEFSLSPEIDYQDDVFGVIKLSKTSDLCARVCINNMEIPVEAHWASSLACSTVVSANGSFAVTYGPYVEYWRPRNLNQLEQGYFLHWRSGSTGIWGQSVDYGPEIDDGISSSSNFHSFFESNSRGSMGSREREKSEAVDCSYLSISEWCRLNGFPGGSAQRNTGSLTVDSSHDRLCA